MKKPLTLLLALVIAIGLGVPAMAAPGFSIVAQPRDTTINFGESFTLSVEAEGPAGQSAAYQWRRVGGSWNYSIPGATGPTLHLSYGDDAYPDAFPRNDSYAPASYQCVITLVPGNETLTSARATVAVRPIILTQPRSLNIGARESFTLGVEAQAAPGWELTYQWVKWGYGDIAGATGPSLRLSDGDPAYPEAVISIGSATGYYDCVITVFQRDGSGNKINEASFYSLTGRVERKLNFGEFIRYAFGLATNGVFAILLFPIVFPAMLLYLLLSSL